MRSEGSMLSGCDRSVLELARLQLSQYAAGSRAAIATAAAALRDIGPVLLMP